MAAKFHHNDVRDSFSLSFFLLQQTLFEGCAFHSVRLRFVFYYILFEDLTSYEICTKIEEFMWELNSFSLH